MEGKKKMLCSLVFLRRERKGKGGKRKERKGRKGKERIKKNL